MNLTEQPARYFSICRKCGDQIRPGDGIVCSRFVWEHARCPENGANMNRAEQLKACEATSILSEACALIASLDTKFRTPLWNEIVAGGPGHGALWQADNSHFGTLAVRLRSIGHAFVEPEKDCSGQVVTVEGVKYELKKLPWHAQG